ncbi:MAG: TolC family protein, partial [Burkholderiales bacterium]|nr:TolC family protein [Burkholderiales bacterium]
MRNRFSVSAAAVLFILVTSNLPLSAQAAAPLSITEALAIADRDSSLLAAQRSAISAAGEMTASARELPDPKLKFGIDNLPADGPDRYSLTRDFMTMRKIGVAQEFVRGEKREIKGRRAENELQREQAMLGDARAALRRDVAQAWIERYFAERMAKIVDEQYAETDLQRESLQTGLRAGKAQAADLLAVQVNLQSLLDRRAEYRRQAARATALLSRWLGAESARPLAALPTRLLPAQHRDVATHAENHPHLQTLERQIDVARNDAALARAANKPDWGLEVAYAQRGPQYSNMLSVQVSIDLPLFQANRQDRSVAAKMAQVEQARALKEEALRQYLAEA